MTVRVATHGDTLSLRYALRLMDGTEVLSNLDDPAPDTLTLGDGTLAPNLEQWLIGIAVGERHVFLLEPEQAFGISQPDLIHNLPRAEVETGEPLQVTGLVEFTTADGEFRYRVVSLTIVQPSDIAVLARSEGQVLTLVTCYPFAFIGAAPERFIVRAERFI